MANSDLYERRYPVAVYVPKPGTLTEKSVAPKSACCGDRLLGDRIDLYYEGNLYGFANIETYCDKLMVAADRWHSRYPTVAHMAVPLDALTQVGTWDGEQLLLTDEGEEALKEWLDTTDISLEVART